LHAQRPVGCSASRILADQVEAERAFARAEQRPRRIKRLMSAGDLR
jgi:hypothetical protein